MNFLPVPVAEVDRIWPRLAPGFEQAIRRSTGDMNLPWLYQQCRTGQIVLMIVLQDNDLIGAFAIRPEQTKTGWRTRIVEMWGKDFRNWIGPATDSIRGFGKRSWGAEKVVWEGQRAHQRFVPGSKIIRYIYEV